MSSRDEELDMYVSTIVKLNEAIRAQANTGVQGIDDMVDQMANCTITREHLPDHVMDILLGDQIFGGVKDVEMTAVNLKDTLIKVAAPGDETLGVLVPEYMKSQQPATDDVFSKKTVTRQKINPEVADIIRKRLGQLLSVGASIFAQGVCNQLLIITQTVEKLIRAASYLVPDEGVTTFAADITKEIDLVYGSFSSSYYSDPRLNHMKFSPRDPKQKLRPNDFLFYPILAAAISTGNPDVVRPAVVQEAVKTFRRKLGNVRMISGTENLMEDFVRSAFEVPGQDFNPMLSANLSLLQSAKEKLKKLDSASLEELRRALVADFAVKAKDSTQQLYRAIVTLNPAEIKKIQSMLSGVLNDIVGIA